MLDNYPLSVEEHCSGTFSVDETERLASSSPIDAISLARRTMFIDELKQRVDELMNGEWDAIEEETKVKKEEYTEQRFNPNN